MSLLYKSRAMIQTILELPLHIPAMTRVQDIRIGNTELHSAKNCFKTIPQ